MAKVSVIKYKDLSGVCPDGCQFAADVSSAVIGQEIIDLASYPVECGAKVPTRSCLAIIDPIIGKVWIGETIDSWFVKIGGTATPANNEITTEFTIDGTTHPATTALVDALLYNVTVNEIQVDNIPVTLSTVTYTSDAGTLKGTLTFPGTLGLNSIVKVIYYNN